MAKTQSAVVQFFSWIDLHPCFQRFAHFQRQSFNRYFRHVLILLNVHVILHKLCAGGPSHAYVPQLFAHFASNASAASFVGRRAYRQLLVWGCGHFVSTIQQPSPLMRSILGYRVRATDCQSVFLFLPLFIFRIAPCVLPAQAYRRNLKVWQKI